MLYTHTLKKHPGGTTFQAPSAAARSGKFSYVEPCKSDRESKIPSLRSCLDQSKCDGTICANLDYLLLVQGNLHTPNEVRRHGTVCLSVHEDARDLPVSQISWV
jgi:hypothetical protein